MHGLNRLVLSGKVLYLGISDTPAWIVSKANQCKFSLRDFFTPSMMERKNNHRDNAFETKYNLCYDGQLTHNAVQTLVTTVSPNSSSIKAVGPPLSEISSGTSCPCVSPRAWLWPAGTSSAEATSRPKSSAPTCKRRAVIWAHPARTTSKSPTRSRRSPNVKGQS